MNESKGGLRQTETQGNTRGKEVLWMEMDLGKDWMWEGKVKGNESQHLFSLSRKEIATFSLCSVCLLDPYSFHFLSLLLPIPFSFSPLYSCITSITFSQSIRWYHHQVWDQVSVSVRKRPRTSRREQMKESRMCVCPTLIWSMCVRMYFIAYLLTHPSFPSLVLPLSLLAHCQEVEKQETFYVCITFPCF